MECDKMKTLFIKFCINDVICDEKFTLNCTVPKEMRGKNCLKTIELFSKNCKFNKIDKKISLYDQK